MPLSASYRIALQLHESAEPIVDSLDHAGYVVLSTFDGSEALNLRDDPGDIELIVTPIALAGGDGIEIARRARTQREAVPVVFASGHIDQMAKANPPAPRRCLSKPYSMEAVRVAIEEPLDETAGSK